MARALLASFAFSLLFAATNRVAAQARPRAISVALPIELELAEFDFLGILEPLRRTPIIATISGKLAKVNVRDGMTVKKGDILFELDPESLRKELKAIEAKREKELATLKKWLMQLSDAMISDKTTKAELELLEARRNLAEAVVKQETSRIDMVRLQLAQAVIVAPEAGFLVLAPGISKAASGDAILGSTTLATILQANAARVTFQIDEATRRALQTEMVGKKPLALLMGLRGEKGYPHTGRVEFIDNRIHPVSRLIDVDAEFPNPTGALDKVILADTDLSKRVRIRLPLGKARLVLMVPDLAVGMNSAGKSIVMVVGAGNKVEHRAVSLGRVYGPYRIIEKGLLPTDEVIVRTEAERSDTVAKSLRLEDFVIDYRLALRPGTIVEPIRVTMPRPER